MKITEATEADLSSIVDVLKLSLGDKLMPKSEAFWKWKHVDNPFGPSPVLLAKEGDTLIGVRAFMRWQWKDSQRDFKAVRAVDTAVHPDFQGKGIFTVLTRQLVDQCKAAGYDFVFNTPNKKSLPGYLKLGWEPAGQLPVRVAIRPVSAARSILGFRQQTKALREVPLATILDHPGLAGLLRRVHQGGLQTSCSIGYLRWRYLAVPVANYHGSYLERNGDLTALMICRIKNSKWGSELRITDMIHDNTVHDHELARLVRNEADRHEATFVSSAALLYPYLKGIRVNGPLVTVRALADGSFDRMLDGFDYWRPSLGDLELF